MNNYEDMKLSLLFASSSYKIPFKNFSLDLNLL